MAVAEWERRVGAGHAFISGGAGRSQEKNRTTPGANSKSPPSAHVRAAGRHPLPCGPQALKVGDLKDGQELETVSKHKLKVKVDKVQWVWALSGARGRGAAFAGRPALLMDHPVRQQEQQLPCCAVADPSVQLHDPLLNC
jgi:hypothetical protein